VPMAPARRTLRRVITVHLADGRSAAIVRLRRESSAANDRLLAADRAVPATTLARVLAHGSR
jgi:hypothetical protein